MIKRAVSVAHRLFKNMNTLEINGRINTAGKFVSADFPELKYFLEQNKGSFVTVTYTSYNRTTSKAMLGYYYNFLVPMFVRLFKETGLWLLPEQAETKMRKSIPIMTVQERDINRNMWVSKLITFEELDRKEKILYIEFLKKYASENFNYAINDQTWKKD